MPWVWFWSSRTGKGQIVVDIYNSTTNNIPVNYDSSFANSSTRYWLNSTIDDVNSRSEESIYKYSSRPTNTSVLYCIKY